MRVQKKRRREAKTDYTRRIALLKSGLPRLVFRKTNRYIIAQYVESKSAQDKAIMEVTSKDLIEYGWPKEARGSLKSIPACYLTGYLIGKKILKEKMQTPTVDFGMYRMIHKNRQFAFLNGLIDSGLKIKCDKENFPEKERIEGKKLKKDISKEIEKIKSNIDKK